MFQPNVKDMYNLLNMKTKMKTKTKTETYIHITRRTIENGTYWGLFGRRYRPLHQPILKYKICICT
jgi:hypothetical protein